MGLEGFGLISKGTAPVSQGWLRICCMGALLSLSATIILLIKSLQLSVMSTSEGMLYFPTNNLSMSAILPVFSNFHGSDPVTSTNKITPVVGLLVNMILVCVVINMSNLNSICQLLGLGIAFPK